MPPTKPVLLAFLGLALLVAGCASPQPEASPQGGVASEISHIHGLAVNPDAPGELYIATHHGLFRHVNGSFARVGTMKDDLMAVSYTHLTLPTN